MAAIGPLSSATSGIAQTGVTPGIKPQGPVEQVRSYSPAAAGKSDGGGIGKTLSGGSASSSGPAAAPPGPNTPRGSLLDISV